MKVYDDKLMMELKDYDLTKGYLEDTQIIFKHHEATPRKFHYEIMEHDSIFGLRHEVEDAPAQSAWDEYEAVKRYVPYTEEELAEEKAKQEAIKKAQAEAEFKAQAEKEQAEKIARIDAIDAQVTYTAMMTDTLMVEETTESTDSEGK